MTHRVWDVFVFLPRPSAYLSAKLLDYMDLSIVDPIPDLAFRNVKLCLLSD